jgi:hypothetical protein
MDVKRVILFCGNKQITDMSKQSGVQEVIWNEET